MSAFQPLTGRDCPPAHDCTGPACASTDTPPSTSYPVAGQKPTIYVLRSKDMRIRRTPVQDGIDSFTVMSKGPEPETCAPIGPLFGFVVGGEERVPPAAEVLLPDEGVVLPPGVP